MTHSKFPWECLISIYNLMDSKPSLWCVFAAPIFPFSNKWHFLLSSCSSLNFRIYSSFSPLIPSSLTWQPIPPVLASQYTQNLTALYHSHSDHLQPHWLPRLLGLEAPVWVEHLTGSCIIRSKPLRVRALGQSDHRRELMKVFTSLPQVLLIPERHTTENCGS